MARATFYYQIKQLHNTDKYADVRARIVAIYHLHKGRYGYRRITLALRDEGFTINHKTVERLMRREGLKSLVRVKKYRSYRGQEGRIVPNVLKRNFEVDRPNRKWATDVTEFSLFGQKRYLSPVMDLYNGEIISYTVSKHPNLLMVTSMLDKALRGIDSDGGLILHSDQGWHYQNPTYQNILKEKGVTQRMSRKGNCLDNAAMESIFGTLKSELLYLQQFRSIDHFTAELKKYIDYYNNQRIKTKLKGMSPVKYRTHSFAI
jgi:putative transposase